MKYEKPVHSSILSDYTQRVNDTEKVHVCMMKIMSHLTAKIADYAAGETKRDEEFYSVVLSQAMSFIHGAYYSFMQTDLFTHEDVSKQMIGVVILREYWEKISETAEMLGGKPIDPDKILPHIDSYYD